jgi:hypothetical protein
MAKELTLPKVSCQDRVERLLRLVGSSYLVCPKRSYESQKVLRSQSRSGRVDASLVAFVGFESLLPLCSLDGIFRSWCRSLKHDVGVDLRSGACNPLENAENDDWFYEVR